MKTDYCSECDCWRERDTFHCEECEVCIKKYDHHCIFFGKCIGGGNIVAFYTTLALVVVVFCMFGFITVMDIVLAK